MGCKPDNAEESFKCSQCGTSFSRSGLASKKCPVCGYECTTRTCSSFGTSNEDY